MQAKEILNQFNNQQVKIKAQVEQHINRLFAAVKSEAVNMEISYYADGTDSYPIPHLNVTVTAHDLDKIKVLFHVLSQKIDCEAQIVDDAYHVISQKVVITGININGTLPEIEGAFNRITDREFKQAFDPAMANKEQFLQESAKKISKRQIIVERKKQEMPVFKDVTDDCKIALENLWKIRHTDPKLLHKLQAKISPSTNNAYEYMVLAVTHAGKMDSYLRVADAMDPQGISEFVNAANKYKLIEPTELERIETYFNQKAEVEAARKNAAKGNAKQTAPNEENGIIDKFINLIGFNK